MCPNATATGVGFRWLFGVRRAIDLNRVRTNVISDLERPAVPGLCLLIGLVGSSLDPVATGGDDVALFSGWFPIGNSLERESLKNAIQQGLYAC